MPLKIVVGRRWGGQGHACFCHYLSGCPWQAGSLLGPQCPLLPMRISSLMLHLCPTPNPLLEGPANEIPGGN